MNQSLNILKIINSVVLDNSNIIELKQQNKKLMVQNWINNIQFENKFDDNDYVHNMIESWKLENLQENIKNLKFPSIKTVNSMNLKQSLAYEAMLVEIVDKVPSELNTSVNILLHLKIISNNQLYKFKIFE
jgi:hypothetical protein